MQLIQLQMEHHFNQIIVKFILCESTRKWQGIPKQQTEKEINASDKLKTHYHYFK